MLVRTYVRTKRNSTAHDNQDSTDRESETLGCLSLKLLRCQNYQNNLMNEWIGNKFVSGMN